MAPNSIEFVVAYFAVLRAGFVAVPINPQLTGTELRAVLQDCGAAGADRQRRSRHPGVHWVPLTPDGLRQLADAGAAAVSSPPDAETLAALLYTAGTSGEPKAAMLTHRALLAHLSHLEALERRRSGHRGAGDAAAVPRVRPQRRAGQLGRGRRPDW